MSLGTETAWPPNAKKLDWPRDGVTYSYEYYKYIKPEKLARWLATFGEGKGKYVVRRINIPSLSFPKVASHRANFSGLMYL